MKKSTKTKTPAAPQVKKFTSSTKKKAVGTKPAVKKAVAAPAKTKPAAKKAAAPKKATPAPKKAAPKKVAVEKAAVKEVAVKKVATQALAKKAAAPKKKAAAKTVITAKINVGFGNALFLRGEGPGLSWDLGSPMNCAGDDEWTIAIAGADAPIVAKFLVNDASWSTGRDYEVAVGDSVVLEPTF